MTSEQLWVYNPGTMNWHKAGAHAPHVYLQTRARKNASQPMQCLSFISSSGAIMAMICSIHSRTRDAEKSSAARGTLLLRFVSCGYHLTGLSLRKCRKMIGRGGSS